MVIEFGREWHEMVENNHSMSYASLHLVNRNHQKSIAPEKIKPSRNCSPSFRKMKNGCLKILKLKRNDLSSDASKAMIKTAYKRMAKVYHPDAGGSEDQFKKTEPCSRADVYCGLKTLNTPLERRFRTAGAMMAFTSRWAPPL